MLQVLNRQIAPEGGEATQQSGFDLRELLHFVWRQWKFIAAVAAVFLLIGAVQLARQVPVYTAYTQILLDPRKERAAGSDQILSEVSMDLPMIESQLAILRSPALLRRVVEKERLTLDPEFGNGGAAIPGWTIMGSIGSLLGQKPAAAPAPAAIVPADIMASTMALGGAMSAARAGQGYVLLISVTSVDPARAARLANAIADAYAVDKLDARFEAARRASAWLGDRLEELRGQLRNSEEAVAKFRAEKGILQSNSGMTLNQQQLADLNNRLIAARGETAEKKSRYDIVVRGTSSRASVQNLPDIMNSGSISGLRAQLNSVSQREADLLARYSDRHPLVVNVRAEKADIERSINAELTRLAESVKNDYELAKAREDAIERAIKEGTGQSGLDSETAINLRELERTAAVNKTMFEEFLQRSRVTQEQATFEPNDVRVISPALPPGAPSAPVRSRVLGMFLLIGLVLGFGGAFAIETLNAGFTTPKQVEEALQAPLLASVSHMPAQELSVQGKQFPVALYPIVKPLSRMSESIRTLRSGIQMTDVDHPPKIIQFCSTMPSEGKTTIAMATAASAAQSGLKVLLIDADLRHPSTSRLAGRERETGLVDYLVGTQELSDVVKMFPEGMFWVLPAGGKTQNPPDLLSSEKFRNMLALVRKSFDLVVIDTPPIGPVIDASVVAQYVDKIIYVVKWAATARELVQRSLHQLAGHKKIAGIVFNSVNEGRAQKYGKYAYGYYYGNRYYKKYYSES